MKEWDESRKRLYSKHSFGTLNAIDKFAVAVEKEGQTFEHRGKSKSGHFAKTIFYLIILSYTCEPWKCMSS